MKMVKMITENKVVSWSQMLEWLTGTTDVNVGSGCDGDTGLYIDQTELSLLLVMHLIMVDMCSNGPVRFCPWVALY